ncbi:TerB family tellurite resistance protein [Roseiterribacter gracilis]|uniref:Co-chaperone DjlA N-terminal domain-containing protein n=1 Tax=Roseiterribacter gracilis TaxID=2812848 RepID=A0A8S8XC96_9PROT|nr:hypothetical protein TMPK1_33100 [Rhodospirillales bacterium TMPK1]
MALLDILRRWFGSPDQHERPKIEASPVHRAAAVLLAHMALEDGALDPREIDRMCRIAYRAFHLDPAAARSLIDASLQQAKQDVDLFRAIQPLVAEVAPRDRVKLIEMLWEVVYADGVVHDREVALMRKVAGLLYVTDADSGAARKRVLARGAGLN